MAGRSRVRGWQRLAAALLALGSVTASCSCGSDSVGPTVPPTTAPDSPPTPTTPTPPPTTPPTTAPPAACGTDRLGADRPVVQLQPPGAVARTDVVGVGSFPCASRVWVEDGGVAGFVFSADGACDVAQNTAAKPATAVVREADGTMLRLEQGMATCTLGQPILLCPPGSILPTSTYTQVATACDPDPVFRVAVFAGTATIVTPAGERFEMGPGQQVQCDPTACLEVQPTADAKFSATEQRAFTRHISLLRLSPNIFGIG